MKYMLLIHQGSTPLPGSDEWESLSQDEQKAVYADYQAINQTPGVTPADVAAALALVERLGLDRYPYLHSTRAELLRRLDRVEDARAAYDRALKLVHSDAERRFLEQRLVELQGGREPSASRSWRVECAT